MAKDREGVNTELIKIAEEIEVALSKKPQTRSSEKWYDTGFNDPIREQEIETYWGVCDKFDSDWNASFTSLGLKSRLTLPLFEVARARYNASSGRARLKATTFAEDVLEIVDRRAVPLLTHKKREPTKAFLSMFRRSHDGYPPLSVVTALQTATLIAFKKHVPEADPTTVLEIIENVKKGSITDVFLDLVTAYPPTGRDFGNLKSRIDQALPLELQSEQPAEMETYKRIRGALHANDIEQQVLIVHGPPYCGKTIAIERLLFNDCNANPDRPVGSPICFIPSSDPGTALPVFAISCKDRSMSEIVDEVFDFLVPTASKQFEEGRTPRRSVASRLDHILKAAIRPALYVFCDLFLYYDQIDATVKEQPIDRLIGALCSASGQTRVVITAQKSFSDVQFEKRFWRPRMAEIEAAPNILGHIEQLFSKDQSEKENALGASFQAHVDKIVPDADQQAYLKECEVSGAKLIAYTGVCQIRHSIDPKLTEAFLNCVRDDQRHRLIALERRSELGREVPDYPSVRKMDKQLKRASVKMRLSSNLFHQKLWTLLCENFESKHLMRAALLLVASHDGLVETTLKSALRDWQTIEPLPDDPHPEKIIEQLQAAAKRTGHHLLRFRNDIDVKDYERTIEEQELLENENTSDTLRNVSFDTPVREKLCLAVPEIDPDGYSMANILVARAARRRTVGAKLESRSLFGLRSEHLKRGTMVYTCLLSSARPDLWKHRSVKQPSDRVLSLERYALNPANAGDVVAILRFAYRVLIKKELDYDGRLTMVLDSDQLRLELLLSLFHPGRRIILKRNGDEALKGGFKKYHERAFTAEERADILQAIGIAALYSDKPKLIVQAIEHLDKIPDDEKSDRVWSAWIRLQCIRADALVLNHNAFNAAGVQPNNRQQKLFGLLEYLKGCVLPKCEELRSQVSAAKSAQRVLHRILAAQDAVSDASWAVSETLRAVIAEQQKIATLTDDPTASFGGKGTFTIIQALLGSPAIKYGMSEGQARDFLKLNGHWTHMHHIDELTLGCRSDCPKRTKKNAKSIKSDCCAHIADDPIKNLTEDWVFQDWREREKAIDLADDLLDLALVRLSRFAGGERVYVLNSQIMLNLAKGEFKAAKRNQNRVVDHLMFAGISAGLRADLYWGMAQLEFMVAHSDLDNPDRISCSLKGLRRAQRDCLFLNGFARAHNLPEFQARASLLSARIAIDALSLGEGEFIEMGGCYRKTRNALVQIWNARNGAMLPHYRGAAISLQRDLDQGISGMQDFQAGVTNCACCNRLIVELPEGAEKWQRLH